MVYKALPLENYQSKVWFQCMFFEQSDFQEHFKKWQLTHKEVAIHFQVLYLSFKVIMNCNLLSYCMFLVLLWTICDNIVLNKMKWLGDQWGKRHYCTHVGKVQSDPKVFNLCKWNGKKRNSTCTIDKYFLS